MHFPFGPLRNAGDFRVWIVASCVWVLLATLFVFYIFPPASQEPPTEHMGALSWEDAQRADRIHGEASAMCLYVKMTEYKSCLERAEKMVVEEDIVVGVLLRLAIILLPPFVAAGAIWLLVSTVAWVRRGYAE